VTRKRLLRVHLASLTGHPASVLTASVVVAIAAHLAKDPSRAPLVKARPGLRVPGRTVLGVGFHQFTISLGLLCKLLIIGRPKNGNVPIAMIARVIGRCDQDVAMRI
jgi:hypothetical protein